MFVFQRTCREWARASPYQSGCVNGGASGCAHSGSKLGGGAGFTVKLTIRRWSPGSEQVFAGLDQFEVEFSVNPTAAGFTARGGIVGHSVATWVLEGGYLIPAAKRNQRESPQLGGLL